MKSVTTLPPVLSEVLRKSQLFSGLPLPDIDLVASFVATIPLRKGEYLFREGEQVRGFYVMETGAVSLHRLNTSGKEQVIRVFRPGQVFAEAALTLPGGYPADARAVEDSVVAIVPRTEFVRLLHRRPELCLRMLASMSTHLRVLIGLVEDLQNKDVETRLANWLLQHCPGRGEGGIVKLNTAKGILAAEMGTTGETLSRTFAKLRKSGWITVESREIHVLSRRGLKSVLERNLGGQPA